MLSYRVILDVPLPLVVFVSRLLADHRREIGTRDGEARPSMPRGATGESPMRWAPASITAIVVTLALAGCGSAGSSSAAGGPPTVSAGSPSAAAGSPSSAAGSPSSAAGSPSSAAGSPSSAAGSPSAAAGSQAALPSSPGMSRYQSSGSQAAAGTRRARRGDREGVPAWSAAWTAAAMSRAVSASMTMLRRSRTRRTTCPACGDASCGPMVADSVTPDCRRNQPWSGCRARPGSATLFTTITWRWRCPSEAPSAEPRSDHPEFRSRRRPVSRPSSPPPDTSR